MPKVVSRGGIWIPVEGGEKEPIGMRIVETPENPERTEILRDPRSGFIAYAPVGSIKKGEALVRTGGTRTVACGACHGADLQGSARCLASPDVLRAISRARCTTCRSGARRGEWTELMKPVVARLTDEDYVNISAYVASLTPVRRSVRTKN